MPVHSHDGAERLQPEWIGATGQERLHAVMVVVFEVTGSNEIVLYNFQDEFHPDGAY